VSWERHSEIQIFRYDAEFRKPFLSSACIVCADLLCARRTARTVRFIAWKMGDMVRGREKGGRSCTDGPGGEPGERTVF
jgi:hypothetical protein